MEFTYWTLAILLATSLTQASWIPTRNQQQRAERDLAISANVDTAVEVHVSDFATLEELAEDLVIDFRCLLDANPLLSILHIGDYCIVPYSCCGTSCNGKFCSKRPQCASTSITVVPPASSSTSIVTLTSCSTATTSPTSSTDVVPPTSSSTVPPGSPPITPGSSTTTPGSSTIPGIVTTTNSLGQTVISDSSGAVTLTTGISSASVVTLPDGSVVTFQPSTTTPGSPSPPTTVPGVVTTTNSLGQTVISDSSGAVTLTTGISTASVVTLPDGSIVTFQPSTTATGTPSPPTTVPGVVTTTNSLGQTVISDSSGAVTLPTGISTASVVTLPGGSIVTFQPSTTATGSPSPPTTISGVVTTTNSLGQTVISDISGAVTLPTGISTASVVTLPDGSIVTFQPSTTATGTPSPPTTVAGVVTTTNSLGQTVISDSSGAVTLPTGISTASVVTLPDSSIVTFQPTTQATSSSSLPGILTTTDPAGETVISSSGEGFTIPTAVTTPITLTNGDGSIFTFSPTVSAPGSPNPTSSSGPPGIITTTDSAGETVISSSGEGFTIPTAVTTPITVTNGDGSVFTFSPTGPPSSSSTSSSTIPIGGIFPVTTSVPAPKATDGGTEIPCNLWFFDLCIRFGDITIGGWDFNLPTGVRPPGPPPGITFPPSLSISVSISGTLPPWPSLTIGPDNLPTYEPKPTDGPDDGCKTESAEVCLTSTSFGVNAATVTTTSSVLSTCATIFGCDVTDSTSSTATTSTTSSSDYPYSCTLGCTACVAKRGLTTATAAPPLPTTDTKKAKDLFSYARNLTLAERDIPSEANADGIAEFYSEVAGASDTTLVSEDNVGQTEISSSRFKFFDNSELNILVEGLRGCTSVVVVSRLGVYVSHLWEPYFGVNPSYNFQTGVVNYLNTGRDSGLTGGVTENGVTESLTVLVQGGVFGDTATTKIFIMTPATFDLDLTAGVSSADQRASLTNGDFQPLFDGSTATPQGVTLPDRLTPIKTQLGQLMPGVPISQFTYRRQTNDRFLSSDGYGKATVVYSNNQKEDPNTFEPIGPPQQAIWQCWMQGKLMDSDQWDALPGQTSSCPANQKRQAGSLCNSPTTSPGTPTSVPPTTSISSTPVPPTTSTSLTPVPPTTSTSSTPVPPTTLISSTSVPPSSSIPAATPSTVTITPTPSGNSPPPSSNLPTLTTAQSTPAGETCVSTATSTQCALGPNPSETACVTNTYCASFAPTAVTAVTASSIAAPTPTGQVYIDIFTDSDCINVLEQTILNAIGQCYSPTDSKGNPITFACFALTYISTAASNSADLIAYKGSGCFAQFDTDSQTYPNLTSIQYQNEKPFTLGSLSLGSAGE